MLSSILSELVLTKNVWIGYGILMREIGKGWVDVRIQSMHGLLNYLPHKRYKQIKLYFLFLFDH